MTNSSAHGTAGTVLTATSESNLSLERISVNNIDRLEVVAETTISDSNYFYSGMWSLDGSSFALSARIDGREGIWLYDTSDLSFASRQMTNLEDYRGAYNLVFHPDGNLLAGSIGCIIHVWDSDTGDEVAQYVPAAENDLFERCPLWGLDYSPDGTLLAAITFFGLGVWDTETGELYASFTFDELGMSQAGFFAQGLSFSPNGEYLAFADSFDERLYIWTLNPRETPFAIEGSGFALEIRDIAFDPTNSNIVATANGNNAGVQLWDIDARRIGDYIEGHRPNDGGMNYVAFSPDGMMLAGISMDDQLEFWNVGMQASIRVIDDAGVCCIVSFNPSGTLLVTMKWTEGIQLWGVLER